MLMAGMHLVHARPDAHATRPGMHFLGRDVTRVALHSQPSLVEMGVCCGRYDVEFGKSKS